MAKKIAVEEKKPVTLADIKAMSDFVFVRQDGPPKVTESGIHLPDSAKQGRQRSGVVVACGPGRTDDRGNFTPMPLGLGDRVYYGEFNGQDCRLDDETLKVLRLVEVMAKVAAADIGGK